MTTLVVLATTLGCARPRVVLVPPGGMVQLAENVKAKVYVDLHNGERVPSKNRVTLHEGYWVGPDTLDTPP